MNSLRNLKHVFETLIRENETGEETIYRLKVTGLKNMVIFEA